MSWGGPGVGTAPYQPSPFPNGQPGFGQQPVYQYGQQPGYGQYAGAPSYSPNGPPPQRPPENRPPKKKGNPIITRYPPPPGYRGPAQAPGQYAPNQYSNQHQHPQQGYPQGYTAPQTYPTPGYPASAGYPPTPAYSPQAYGPPQSYPPQQNYPQQSFPPTPNYQYAQQAYPPAQGYSQPPTYPVASGYAPPQTTYQTYPPQSAPTVDPNQHTYSQQPGWQPSHGQAPYPPHEPPSAYGGPPQDPNATPTPTSAHLATTQHSATAGHPDSVSSDKGEKPQLFLAWDDWDFDFDGAIWPKSNEPVDPNLSLGVIIWRPAKQVTRALPSTYEDAEEQALKPPAEKLGNGESVSIYFTVENSHEAFLDVRQTDEWHKIKSDPIFVVFPDEKDMDLIPLEECIAQRDRPDVPLEDAKEDEDEEMPDSTWNVMDNLEQALAGHEEAAKAKLPATIKDHDHSRTQEQEDILAKLGVTGSPKPPSDEPVSYPFPSLEGKPSASLPEKPPLPSLPQIPQRPDQAPPRSQSYGGQRTGSYGAPPLRPYGSMSASASTSTHGQQPPPPPPAPDRQEYDPWNPRNSQTLSNGRSSHDIPESPARSEGSNHTLAGSDFETEKPVDNIDPSPTTVEASASTPVLKLERSDSSFSRKRNYEDSDQTDDKVRQQDDHTKRKRRSEVAAAYSRR